MEKLKAYVSAKSWAVYDVYLDEGISGKNMTERPAINRMLDDIKAGYTENVPALHKAYSGNIPAPIRLKFIANA